MRSAIFTALAITKVVCDEVTLLSSPQSVNSTNHVQLASYDYDSGTLDANVYIYNDDYNKEVLLYYANLDGESSPLTSIAASFSTELDDNWELWTISSAILAEEGLTEILNVTYTDEDADVTYYDVVNLAVTESGNVSATTTSAPSPLIKPTGFYHDIDTWLEAVKGSETYESKERVFDNINVNGSVKGLVIAAQSYSEPDYAYHWVRDASLTFNSLVSLYESLPSRSSNAAKYLENLVWEYIQASISEQNDPTAITGLGEPKFYLNNNTGYLGSWGRPQNDGAATRASTLIKFAKAYLSKGGDKSYVLKHLWNAPIKMDLQFIANNWTVESYDLWEEVKSDHFYTKFVQRKALLDGISFAKSSSINDHQLSKTLTTALNSLNDTLSQFVYPIRKLILTDYGPVQNGKYSYKDVSVILALNHAYNDDGVFGYTNDYVLSTAYEVATSFIPVYTNLSSVAYDSKALPLAPPTGRYPEDVYNGVSSSEGNPWYLSCAAFAEFFYKASIEFNKVGEIELNSLTSPFWEYYGGGVAGKSSKSKTQKYKKGSSEFKKLISSLQGWGDAYLRTVKHYADIDGRLPEEFNRVTGEPTGAKDLTWSYASILTAAYARAQAKGDSSFTETLAKL